MRLIHLALTLNFEKEFISESISQRLHKALTGKTSLCEELEEPGVEFRSLKKRQQVNWDSTSCRIVMESVADYSECITKMAAILETINQIAPIGRLSRKEFVTYWIIPANDYSFRLLEKKYRDTFIAPQRIWDNGYDSSVIVDMKINGMVLHHQSGAMERTQLRREYAAFKLDDVPPVFVFLLATVESFKMIEYSYNDISCFLNMAVDNCKIHSELFEETIKAIL